MKYLYTYLTYDNYFFFVFFTILHTGAKSCKEEARHISTSPKPIFRYSTIRERYTQTTDNSTAISLSKFLDVNTEYLENVCDRSRIILVQVGQSGKSLYVPVKKWVMTLYSDLVCRSGKNTHEKRVKSITFRRFLIIRFARGERAFCRGWQVANQRRLLLFSRSELLACVLVYFNTTRLVTKISFLIWKICTIGFLRYNYII